jgi:translocation and assembly module TamA
LIDPESAAPCCRAGRLGPAFRFGPLEVTGLADYDQSLIERYRPPEAGEPYSQERLLRFQTALQNTSYFASVVVDIDRHSATPAPRRCRFSSPRPSRGGSGLVGVSSNTGYRVETSYRDAHFLDKAYNLVSGLRIEQRRQLAYADVFLPPTPAGYLDSVGALVEHTHIAGLQTGASRLVWSAPFRGATSKTALRSTTSAKCWRPTTAWHQRNALTANWSWTGRFVDNILDPPGAGAQSAARRRLPGGVVRSQLRARLWALPALPAGDAAGRGDPAGGGRHHRAESRDGVPQDFLFRTGGAQTVRAMPTRAWA